MNISTRETKILKDVGFSENVLSLIREITDAKIKKSTFNNEELTTNAISFLVSENQTKELIYSLRDKLSEIGYLAFVSDIKYSFDKKTLETEYDFKLAENEVANLISIIKANDPYDILKIMGTAAPNFDIDETQEIIDQLKNWEKLCSFDIRGASHDWIILDFNTLPDDLNSFAE